MAVFSWTWNGIRSSISCPTGAGARFAAWLTAHPGAEIISRDRSGEYAEGAPQAVHVADRFHLLRNLRDVVLRIFKRHTKHIAHAAQGAPAVPGQAPMILSRLRLDREASRERKRMEMQERFETVQQLAAQGMSRSAIARALGLHRHPVQKYLAGDTAPERQHATWKTSALMPYQGYVLERWQSGCRNAKQLWREIAAQGYPGAYENVARLTGYLRKRVEAGHSLPRAPTGLTPTEATGIVLMRSEKRNAGEQQMLAQLADLHADLGATLALFASFAALVRTHDARNASAQQLDEWITEATTSGLPEMAAFATKLRQDREAVFAALTLPYSQGQTEGQVNKLKRVKRAMYDSVGEWQGLRCCE